MPPNQAKKSGRDAPVIEVSRLTRRFSQGQCRVKCEFLAKEAFRRFTVLLSEKRNKQVRSSRREGLIRRSGSPERAPAIP